MYLNNFPVTGTYGGGHHGVDIACPTGTPLPAVVDGTVVYEGFIQAAVAGYRDEIIIIVQSNGFFIVYGHLSRSVVNTGQRVKAGEVIGYSGNTGYVLPKPRNNSDLVSGAHLHIERRNGTKAASKGLSAYASQDIMPLLRDYGRAQGSADLTIDIREFARIILDVIEDKPHYEATQKEAFEGHVGWLWSEGRKDVLNLRRWAKGIMANNGVLNATYMRDHLSADQAQTLAMDKLEANLRDKIEQVDALHSEVRHQAETIETQTVHLTKQREELAKANEAIATLKEAAKTANPIAALSPMELIRIAVKRWLGGE